MFAIKNVITVIYVIHFSELCSWRYESSSEVLKQFTHMEEFSVIHTIIDITLKGFSFRNIERSARNISYIVLWSSPSEKRSKNIASEEVDKVVKELLKFPTCRRGSVADKQVFEFDLHGDGSSC